MKLMNVLRTTSVLVSLVNIFIVAGALAGFYIDQSALVFLAISYCIQSFYTYFAVRRFLPESIQSLNNAAVGATHDLHSVINNVITATMIMSILFGVVIVGLLPVMELKLFALVGLVANIYNNTMIRQMFKNSQQEN